MKGNGVRRFPRKCRRCKTGNRCRLVTMAIYSVWTVCKAGVVHVCESHMQRLNKNGGELVMAILACFKRWLHGGVGTCI